MAWNIYFYGFYIRHAKNVEMNNVEIGFLGKETPPAIILTDVKNIQFNNVKAHRAPNAALLMLKNVSVFGSNSGNIFKRNFKLWKILPKVFKE